MKNNTVRGRFAPSPSGRMHLGNVFAALMAWLSVRSQGGEMVLRMEDLDTQRTRPEYAQQLRDDLTWLGLTWDWETQPQSQRTAVYDRAFQQLMDGGHLYPCYCTRAQLHSVNAPHASDGTYIYPGTCRGLTAPPPGRPPGWRLRVPDLEISLEDLLQGPYSQNLFRDCGDFLLRRSDGAYLYQLAVTVDDGEAGITEVVRGMDLLSSTPRQMYLQSLLGLPHPRCGHVPLLLSPDGRRLSKRDRDMDLGCLRQHCTPQQIIGHLAHAAGLLEAPTPIQPQDLIPHFSWQALRKNPITLSIP